MKKRGKEAWRAVKSSTTDFARPENSARALANVEEPRRILARAAISFDPPTPKRLRVRDHLKAGESMKIDESKAKINDNGPKSMEIDEMQ